ncbi:MAG: helix-hairpin-helix domain-containing protein [Marinobacter sp.]
MAKKAKSSVDKIVKKVNKEFEKTSSQIEGLISDAMKQFDTLQHQVQDPVRKLLKEVDELREREMKRFNDEFERRLDEFHELQSNILERLGVASKEDIRKAEKESKKELKKSPASAASKPAKKPAAKKAAPKNTAAKKTAAKKTPAAKTKKAADKSDLTLVKGIGPATAKKMQDAGITSIDQIANPSAADQEKLNAFSSIKGFDQLTAEAKKIN